MRISLVAVVTGLVLAVAPATASVRTAAIGVGQCGNITLTNSNLGNKATPNGVSNQLYLGNGNAFCIASSGGLFAFQQKSNRANCIGENNGRVILFGCNGGQTQQWTFSINTGAGDWVNGGTIDVAYANSDHAGYKLYASGNPAQGTWTNWRWNCTSSC